MVARAGGGQGYGWPGLWVARADGGQGWWCPGLVLARADGGQEWRWLGMVEALTLLHTLPQTLFVIFYCHFKKAII